MEPLGPDLRSALRRLVELMTEEDLDAYREAVAEIPQRYRELPALEARKRRFDDFLDFFEGLVIRVAKRAGLKR